MNTEQRRHGRLFSTLFAIAVLVPVLWWSAGTGPTPYTTRHEVAVRADIVGGYCTLLADAHKTFANWPFLTPNRTIFPTVAELAARFSSSASLDLELQAKDSDHVSSLYWARAAKSAEAISNNRAALHAFLVGLQSEPRLPTPLEREFGNADGAFLFYFSGAAHDAQCPGTPPYDITPNSFGPTVQHAFLMSFLTQLVVTHWLVMGFEPTAL